MKSTIATVLLSLATVTAWSRQDPAKSPTDDATLVRRAALDYVEALYEAKPERIERSVHEKLVKYGFWRKDRSAPYVGESMTKQELSALAKTWNAKGNRADARSVKEVVVFDVLDQTAVAKVTAVWGVDHLQLAKFDGKWQIVHILWQSPPEEKK